MNARSFFRIYTWTIGCLVALAFALLLAVYLYAAATRLMKSRRTVQINSSRASVGITAPAEKL